MTTTKFTPGPWVYKEDEEGGEVCAPGSDMRIADLRDPFGPEPAELQANGYLTASAPDLFAALEAAAYHAPCHCNIGPKEKCPSHNARAALAKARGERQ